MTLRPCPRTLALTALGAAGFALGFPNPLWQIPALVLCYPVALYLLGLSARSRLDALRKGWFTGLMGASAGLYWLAVPVHNVGGLPWLLAAPCALAIGAYVGIYGGLFCLLTHLLRHLPPLRLVLASGLVWYLLEVLRGFFLTGFPWLSLLTAFAPWPTVLQGAAWLGGYGLGAVLTTGALLLAQAFSARQGQKKLLALGCALLLLPPIYGTLTLARDPQVAPLTALSDARPGFFPVIMVEGNIDQNQKWEKAWQQSTVDIYTRLSRQALTDFRRQYAESPTTPPTPLVLWPETAMPFYFENHPVFRPQLLDFVRESHIPLLLGAPGIIRTTPKNFQIFNRAYLVDAQGQAAGFYDKTHLVPFGEYLPPLLDFDFLRPILQGVGDFTPGLNAQPLRTGDLALGLLICYESIFPEIAQQRVADGANVLVNISNDGWFGDSSAPEQHLQLAVLRAVEQGRWLLRSTNTGISAVIDHRGRVVMRGTQFQAQSLTTAAERREGFTPFHRVQPWLPWLGMVALGLLLSPEILRRARRQP